MFNFILVCKRVDVIERFIEVGNESGKALLIAIQKKDDPV